MLSNAPLYQQMALWASGLCVAAVVAGRLDSGPGNCHSRLEDYNAP